MKNELLFFYRLWINALDKMIFGLFRKRRDAAVEIGKVKRKFGYPIHDPEREKSHILEMREEALRLGIPTDDSDSLTCVLMSLCRVAQEPSKQNEQKIMVVGWCPICSWNTSAFQGNGQRARCLRCKTHLQVS